VLAPHEQRHEKRRGSRPPEATAGSPRAIGAGSRRSAASAHGPSRANGCGQQPQDGRKPRYPPAHPRAGSQLGRSQNASRRTQAGQGSGEAREFDARSLRTRARAHGEARSDPNLPTRRALRTTRGEVEPGRSPPQRGLARARRLLRPGLGVVAGYSRGASRRTLGEAKTRRRPRGVTSRESSSRSQVRQEALQGSRIEEGAGEDVAEPSGVHEEPLPDPRMVGLLSPRAPSGDTR
jgi:hypothetical protein